MKPQMTTDSDEGATPFLIEFQEVIPEEHGLDTTIFTKVVDETTDDD